MLDILLIDDEPDLRLFMAHMLRDEGHRVTEVSDGAQALTLVSSQVFDLVVSDVRLPHVDGLAILQRVRQEAPKTDVILMTAYAAVADVVTAVKSGACDYVAKPFDLEDFSLRIKLIDRQRALRKSLDEARSHLAEPMPALSLVGRSPTILRLRDRIATIACSDAPVLITGESGTGKELVARMLHEASERRERPFIAVNCAAFPETLLEAELFGHERGAFTGAVRKRDGRFKAADGGTLLLDEVAEMPLPAQAKLLRVLQEGRLEPLGTNESVRVDVRLISATHRNLKERIADGLFREDLYYRLKVLDVEMPPLCERQGDLPLLLHHFLDRLTPPGRQPPGFSPRAWAALSEYAFPGNVRELAHAIEHAVVLARGPEIDIEHLPADIAGAVAKPAARDSSLRPLGTAMKEFEREYLLRALTAAGGRRTKAAELLGISRKNLWEKLRAHGIAQSATGSDPEE